VTRRYTLAVRAPFHLEATVRVLQRRPSNLVDLWEDDRYLRVLALPEGLVLIEVEGRSSIGEPDVGFSIRCGKSSSETARRVLPIVRRILGLDVDPRPLHRVAESELAIRPSAVALRGMRPPRFAGLFEAFANVLPFQQLSLDAGVAIVGRLVRKFGAHLDHDGRRFHAFPTAEAIAEARPAALRACGLSAPKAHALRNLARVVESRALTEDQLAGMSTNAALRVLTELPGVGPWSAGLVLLRGLGRLDVFPPGDVGAARGLRALMGLAPQAPFDHLIERWGEFRGYLYFCALGRTLLRMGLIRAAPEVHRSTRSDASG
jgi:3-methyladenine DNA glycosylase/8-oxoguanine DNA glycosylase